MLTNVELDYMTKRNDIPYPGDNYSLEALKEVKAALIEFKNHYESRTFDIEFSNGDNIVFEIQSMNLPHMLGMEFQNVIASGDDIAKKLLPKDTNKVTAFGILSGIVENPEQAIEVNRQLHNRLFNFYRLKGRAEIFQQFSAFYNFNFGCINYDKDNANKNGFNTNMRSDRFLFVDSNSIKVPYYMMGLKRLDESGERLCIETLFANTSQDKMFRDQTISYPINVNINDGKNLIQKEADYSTKLNILKKLKGIETQTGAKVESYYDQVMSYSKLARLEEKKVLEKKLCPTNLTINN